ncbi:MAG: hypothetical protein NZ734_16730, partial [Paracoccus sp.]|nr:hypothetical protein [Paracoccus sp. (in: a-proteobacteria)]
MAFHEAEIGQKGDIGIDCGAAAFTLALAASFAFGSGGFTLALGSGSFTLAFGSSGFTLAFG